MKARHLAVLFLVAASTWAWGDDTKASLEKARVDYQENIAKHGPGSPEAKSSRDTLRSARKTFHAERRQRSSSRTSDHRRK